MKNSYKITVTDNNEPGRKLEFDYPVHDEMLGLIELTRDRLGFSEEKHNAFMLGLKLLGEVIIEERKSDLFKEFSPHFKDFMQRIKKQCKDPKDVK